MSGITNESSPHRKLANPAALGLAAFSLTTFVLSCYNAGVLLDVKGKGVVFGLAYAYGGGAQMIAGILEFFCNNVFGATAFISYGAFWISFAYFETTIIPAYSKEVAGQAVGIYLFAWMILTLLFLLLAIKITKAHTLLFLFLFITFVFLVIGNFWNKPKVIDTGGWFGIFTAITGWYIMFSIMSTAQFGRTLLPLGDGGFGIRVLKD